MNATRKDTIDDRVYTLYDEYCHGFIDRRQFFERVAALSVAGISALAMADALLPDYAQAQTISFTDEPPVPSASGSSGSRSSDGSSTCRSALKSSPVASNAAVSWSCCPSTRTHGCAVSGYPGSIPIRQTA